MIPTDKPVGKCMANGGNNERDKWPDKNPCCMLSCTEKCGAACLPPVDKRGTNCPHFGGMDNASSEAC